MKQAVLDDNWPQSWKDAHRYDGWEIFGVPGPLGYCYSYFSRQSEALRLITEALSPGSSIMDVAAAQGNFSLLLAERGYNVTWNDLQSNLIDYVKLKYERGNIHYKPGNVFELGLEEQFDAVLITEIIEHVAHPDQFLARISKLLKPGGVVVMTTPNGAYFRNDLPKFSECADPSVFESVQFKPNSDGHIFLIHPDEVPALAEEAGLQLEKVDVFTNFFTRGGLKTEVLLRLLPKAFVDVLERASQRLPKFLRDRLCVHMGVRLRKGA